MSLGKESSSLGRWVSSPSQHGGTGTEMSPDMAGSPGTVVKGFVGTLGTGEGFCLIYRCRFLGVVASLGLAPTLSVCLSIWGCQKPEVTRSPPVLVPNF